MPYRLPSRIDLMGQATFFLPVPTQGLPWSAQPIGVKDAYLVPKSGNPPPPYVAKPGGVALPGWRGLPYYIPNPEEKAKPSAAPVGGGPTRAPPPAAKRSPNP